MKSRMLKLVAIVLVLLVVASAVLVMGCSPQQQETRVIKFAHGDPPAGSYYELIMWAENEVTQRTNGKIEFENFWGGTLCQFPDAVSTVGSGVADMALGLAVYTTVENPNWALDVPVSTTKDQWVLARASQDLVQTEPYIREELDKLNIVPTFGYTVGTHVMVVDKEVSSLDDLKGLRFFVYGQFWTELLANLGLTPASGVLIFEVYDAIDKGVIDGAHTNLSFCNTLKLWEVAKYWDIGAHHFTSGGWDITGIINKDTWDSFSKQTQDVFYDVFSVEFTDRKAQQNIELEQGWKDQIKAMPDVNLVSFFPPETNDIVQQAFEKTKEDIFNKWDSKGAHTREVYENFLKHVDKYDKELADKGYPWER